MQKNEHDFFSFQKYSSHIILSVLTAGIIGGAAWTFTVNGKLARLEEFALQVAQTKVDVQHMDRRLTRLEAKSEASEMRTEKDIVEIKVALEQIRRDINRDINNGR